MRHLIIVGSSGSGKSFLINEAMHCFGNCLYLAQRVTTREKRLNEENQNENRFVSEREFFRLQRTGALLFSWAKAFPDKTKLWYGIPTLQTGKTIIYPANNHLLLNEPSILPEHIRQDMTIIQIKADTESRISRILQRRPPLSARETAYRIADIHGKTVRIRVDIVIINDQSCEASARNHFLSLVSSIGGIND